MDRWMGIIYNFILTSADTDGSRKLYNAASRFIKLLKDSLSMDLEILWRGGTIIINFIIVIIRMQRHGLPHSISNCIFVSSSSTSALLSPRYELHRLLLELVIRSAAVVVDYLRTVGESFQTVIELILYPHL